jgi:hypothetical protein
MTERIDGGRLATPPAPLPGPQESRPGASSPGVPSQFESLVRRLGREIERGENLVEAASARHYASMDAGVLIALQAGIYRYSEAIDLTVKLVDRATSGVKTILESGR